MRVPYGIVRWEVPQRSVPGMALGRHLELDARSLSYAVDEATIIKPAEWLAPIPTLDQGNLGSCTGNAGTRHLAALYGAADLAQIVLAGKTLSADDAIADEAFAVEVYHGATIKDGFKGTYPPDDTGSSGLGVCKALKSAKLISSYRWALSARAWATLLQSGGTIIGTPWFNSWFHPTADGFVDTGDWERSGVAGGHELYVEALEAWDDRDPDKCIVRFHNSWGDSWGDHGCGRMRLSTYQTLKSQIDVKQFVR